MIGYHMLESGTNFLDFWNPDSPNFYNYPDTNPNAYVTCIGTCMLCTANIHCFPLSANFSSYA